MKRDLTGQTFNKLTATSFDHKGRNGLSYYTFKCECGNTKVLCGTDVSQGKTKSCGCFRKQYMSKSRKLPDGIAALNHLFLFYKCGAKSRGLDFSMSLESFAKKTKETCKYCGVVPEQVWQGSKRKDGRFFITSPYVYNGLDRVDNNKGYIEENTVACCRVCNLAKRTLTLEQFMYWIARLVKFHNLKETVTNQSEEN